MTEPLLEMANLSVESTAGRVPIICDLSLRVERGEILALIGESGSGKTTACLAALGHVRPGLRITAGQVCLDNVDLLSLPPNTLRDLRGHRIAYVAQSAAESFNPAHRLIDQYAEVPLQHGVMNREAAKAKAVDLYRRLHLPDAERIGLRYPHQVSGGQLQRAMTAMAMSCGPDLIVFDEPTTALDVTTQIEVLAAIKDVVRQFDMAAIYISHDLAVVAQMADRVMVLRYGEVVEEKPTAEMLARPEQPYTKSLWAVRSLRKAEQPSEDVLLRVRGVDAGYGGVIKVLDQISIDVPRGRTVAIVGESGSGKSTLARVIPGLLPPMRGEVVFDGKPLPPALKDRTTDMLRRLQMIYQMPDTALNPRRRVGDILGRPLQRHFGLDGAARRRRIAELLEMIELDERFLGRFPGELSGGQKQRVCIARAFVSRGGHGASAQILRKAFSRLRTVWGFQ